MCSFITYRRLLDIFSCISIYTLQTRTLEYMEITKNYRTITQQFVSDTVKQIKVYVSIKHSRKTSSFSMLG